MSTWCRSHWGTFAEVKGALLGHFFTGHRYSPPKGAAVPPHRLGVTLAVWHRSLDLSLVEPPNL